MKEKKDIRTLDLNEISLFFEQNNIARFRAKQKKNEPNKQHVAVIGDGAMTAGLAFEGLNHAGAENTNLLVILNDNCMSIDPAVGALKEYLTDISATGSLKLLVNLSLIS